MEDDYAIGLDLGTTYSCIGVYRNGGVEIIPNSMGEKITPSVVIFDGDDILVGEDTTDILVKHFDNCIYEVKRLIGLDLTKKENEDEIIYKISYLKLEWNLLLIQIKMAENEYEKEYDNNSNLNKLRKNSKKKLKKIINL